MRIHPIDPTDPLPPYEQLRTQIATRVASGDLPAGARLPTVRALAAELGIAPNTVARAYRELEADGVLVTEGRRGTRVRRSDRSRVPAAAEAAATYVETCRRLGLTASEATQLVEEGWPTG